MPLHAPAKRHEYIGVLGLVATILLFFCLISYSPQDSSWNALFDKAGAHNRIGKVGAIVSDILFQAIGLSAFLLLIPMAILSWKLIRGRELQSPLMRGVGLGLLIATACTVLQMIPIPLPDANFVPGGVAGVLLADLLLPNLNLTGTVVLLIGTFILGVPSMS